MVIITRKYQTLVLQIAAFFAVGYLIFKFTLGKHKNEVNNGINININKKIDIDNDNNNDSYNDNINKIPVKETKYVQYGTDPLQGKEILIEHYKRENATMVTLCRESDLEDMIIAIRRLEDRFNKNYHYDWVFLNNDEFSEDFKKKVKNFVSGNARFGLIPKEHWSYPEFIDQEKAKIERKKMEDDGVIYAGSESYRHMCRFNSGFFFKHPIMNEYKYYWRVEPHVDFTCDINYDPFKFMKDNNKIYGFTITIYEFLRTIETLWESTKEFLSENSNYINPNNLINFISDDKGDTYNLCHFWSNFEIADMDFWRSKEYQDYFNYLDKKGGFFYERWGDAPVHSIAVSLFLDKDKLHFFNDIGYQHGVYQFCPFDDKLYDSNKCFCKKEDDFTFQGYSCGHQLFNAMNWKIPHGK